MPDPTQRTRYADARRIDVAAPIRKASRTCTPYEQMESGTDEADRARGLAVEAMEAMANVTGDDVSQEVLNSLIFELEEQADNLLEEPGDTIADAFVAVNSHLAAMAIETMMLERHGTLETFGPTIH